MGEDKAPGLNISLGWVRGGALTAFLVHIYRYALTMHIYAYQFAVSDTCYQYLSWRALAALQLIDPVIFQLSTVCVERNDFWSNSNVFKLH